jgi:hypothetical protein
MIKKLDMFIIYDIFCNDRIFLNLFFDTLAIHSFLINFSHKKNLRKKNQY